MCRWEVQNSFDFPITSRIHLSLVILHFFSIEIWNAISFYFLAFCFDFVFVYRNMFWIFCNARVHFSHSSCLYVFLHSWRNLFGMKFKFTIPLPSFCISCNMKKNFFFHLRNQFMARQFFQLVKIQLCCCVFDVCLGFKKVHSLMLLCVMIHNM